MDVPHANLVALRKAVEDQLVTNTDQI